MTTYNLSTAQIDAIRAVFEDHGIADGVIIFGQCSRCSSRIALVAPPPPPRFYESSKQLVCDCHRCKSAQSIDCHVGPLPWVPKN